MGFRWRPFGVGISFEVFAGTRVHSPLGAMETSAIQVGVRKEGKNRADKVPSGKADMVAALQTRHTPL
ncbi:hypothetical protein BT69DRAFT_1284208, partial [Atractiella rhizophila]